MRLPLPHTMHWRPSVPVSALALTDYTSIIHCTWGVYFHHKILCFIGAWYSKHETALPHNSFGDHPSSSVRSGTTESIHIVSHWLDVSVFHQRSQLCSMGADYVSMNCSPTQCIWDHRPQFSSSGTHRINTVECHCTWCQCIHHKDQVGFNGCLIM